MAYQIIEKSRPNGFALILRKYTCDGVDCYCVRSSQDADDIEFDTEAEARKFYDEYKKELSSTPNWELQEKYDNEHGTINGYAPWQYNSEY